MRFGPIRVYPIELLAGFVLGLAAILLFDERRITVLEDIEPRAWAYGPAHDLPGWVAVDVTGVKASGCAFLPAQTEGFALIEGEWIRVDFEFLLARHELFPGRSRPVGYQNFGSWFWPTSPAADRLALEVVHSCSGKRITTRLEFTPTL